MKNWKVFAFGLVGAALAFLLFLTILESPKRRAIDLYMEEVSNSFTRCGDSWFTRDRQGTIHEVRSWDFFVQVESPTTAERANGIESEVYITPTDDTIHRRWRDGSWSEWVEWSLSWGAFNAYDANVVKRHGTWSLQFIHWGLPSFEKIDCDLIPEE